MSDSDEGPVRVQQEMIFNLAADATDLTRDDALDNALWAAGKFQGFVGGDNVRLTALNLALQFNRNGIRSVSDTGRIIDYAKRVEVFLRCASRSNKGPPELPSEATAGASAAPEDVDNAAKDEREPDRRGADAGYTKDFHEKARAWAWQQLRGDASVFLTPAQFRDLVERADQLARWRIAGQIPPGSSTP